MSFKPASIPPCKEPDGEGRRIRGREEKSLKPGENKQTNKPKNERRKDTKRTKREKPVTANLDLGGFDPSRFPSARGSSPRNELDTPNVVYLYIISYKLCVYIYIYIYIYHTCYYVYYIYMLYIYIYMLDSGSFAPQMLSIRLGFRHQRGGSDRNRNVVISRL